jgi:ribokinase
MEILVIGSSNTDMVVRSPRLPVAGETVLGGQFFMNPGGKGANQAVAAARLGGSVRLLAKLGDDLFGRQTLSLLQKEGIQTDYILIDPAHPSGVALITVDGRGENAVVVASGANMSFSEMEIRHAQPALAQAEIILGSTWERLSFGFYLKPVITEFECVAKTIETIKQSIIVRVSIVLFILETGIQG